MVEEEEEAQRRGKEAAEAAEKGNTGPKKCVNACKTSKQELGKVNRGKCKGGPVENITHF